jgi:hypothetical protein
MVESANAPEAGGESDIGHAQIGFIEEFLGEEQAPGLGDSNWWGTEMLLKQAAQVTWSDAQPSSHFVDASFVQSSGLDLAQRTGNRSRCATPGRRSGRSLGPASQARAQACCRCGRCRRKEAHVFRSGRRCRADRPAEDPRCQNADEEPPIETWVSGQPGTFTDLMIQVHLYRLDLWVGPMYTLETDWSGRFRTAMRVSQSPV